MPELRKFSEIRVGKYFICSAYKGKFLKIGPRTAFSFQQNVAHRIAANELVEIYPIQITLADPEPS